MDTEKEQFNETKARSVFRNRRANSSPDQIARSYENAPQDIDRARNAFRKRETKDSWKKSLLRTLMQIPRGAAQATAWPLDVLNMIATGAAFDPGDMEDLRRISEREGIPFDEERYLKGVQEASELFPTISNISAGAERQGIPMEPKNKFQKGVQFASMATNLLSGTGAQTVPQAAITGAGLAGVKHELEEKLPEAIAEPLSFGLLGPAGAGGASASIGKATKPSGLPSRQFEKLKGPREVSPGKIEQISSKLERDFKGISDKIIKESPIGETANKLRTDPTFKSESRELLNEAQTIADSIAEPIPASIIKAQYEDHTVGRVKGFALSEREQKYLELMKEASDKLKVENVSAGELVEQYRKNNNDLGEYFEPGSSKAVNYAKRDALLDQNRAIASTMEIAYPESKLVPVFKEGNARWTKIKDAEAVDEFVSEIFGGEKINFKKLHDFFDKSGYDRIFKRALGDEGFKQFEQLIVDMTSTEVPYKMLRAAKAKGFSDLVNTAGAFILHPSIGKFKLGVDVAKRAYRGFVNAMLDKPQIAVNFKKGADNFLKGRFKEAEKDFAAIDAEVLHPSKKAPSKAQGETLDVTPAEMSPKAKEITGAEPKRLTHVEPELRELSEPKTLKTSPPRKQLEDKRSALQKELDKAEKEYLEIKEKYLRDEIKGEALDAAEDRLTRLDEAIRQEEMQKDIAHSLRNWKSPASKPAPKPKEKPAPKKRENKPKSPTKLQKFQEDLKSAMKKNDDKGKAYNEFYHSTSNPPTAAEKKILDLMGKQWKASEQRVKDIHFEIDRLKQIGSEKRAKSQKPFNKNQGEIETLKRQITRLKADLKKPGMDKQNIAASIERKTKKIQELKGETKA